MTIGHAPKWLLRSALFTEEVWLTRCQSIEIGLSSKTQCTYETPSPDRHDKQRPVRNKRSVVYLFLVVFVKVPWLFDYRRVEGIRARNLRVVSCYTGFFYLFKRPFFIIIITTIIIIIVINWLIYMSSVFFTITAHFRYTERILRIQVHFTLPLR